MGHSVWLGSAWAAKQSAKSHVTLILGYRFFQAKPLIIFAGKSLVTKGFMVP